MKLTRAALRELNTILTPLFDHPNQRRALLTLAFGVGHPLFQQISFEGATSVFIVNLIETLNDYGDSEPGVPALLALLETARDQVGINKQSDFDALIEAFKEQPPPPAPGAVPPPTHPPPANPPPPAAQNYLDTSVTPVPLSPARMTMNMTPVPISDAAVATLLEQLRDLVRREAWSVAVEIGEKLLTLEQWNAEARKLTARAYNGRGVQRHVNDGAYSEAVEDFSRSIDLDPTSSAAYYNRGVSCGKQRDFSSAIADFSRAIELEPNNPDYWYSRSLTFWKLGDTRRETADLERAAALGHAEARRELQNRS